MFSDSGTKFWDNTNSGACLGRREQRSAGNSGTTVCGAAVEITVSSAYFECFCSPVERGCLCTHLKVKIFANSREPYVCQFHVGVLHAGTDTCASFGPSSSVHEFV